MMITDVEEYFAKGCGRCSRFDTADCSARLWQPGLQSLRNICLDAGLEETAKWGHPCYMHAGRNIAIIGAFRGNFRLSFFNAALMKDPEAVLEPQGPNSRHPGMFRFDDPAQVIEKSATIATYLKEAMDYADAGLLPKREARELDWPDELVEALDADPELAEAFHALTPGRQRGYLFNLNGAKQSKTRFDRIAKFRDKILAGKGPNDYK